MRRTALYLLPMIMASGCFHGWRPDSPRCDASDRAGSIERARASLQTEAYAFARTFDADGSAFEPRWPATGGGVAVVSWPDPDRFEGAPVEFSQWARRSHVYDNALFALERIAQGDRHGAAALLTTLAALQLPDGAWGFSFGLDEPFYDAGYVRAGTVAFAVYAFARYANRFDDHRFRAVAGRGADWLLDQRMPGSGLVRAGRGQWSEGGRRFDVGFDAAFAATEHQFDAFFALAALGRVDPDGRWSAGAAALEGAILAHLWDETEGRFVQGISAEGEVDRGSALDAAGTWGALFHLAGGRRAEARRCLDWVERVHGNGRGFRPYGDGPDTTFVEGSIAHALAAYRVDPAAAAASLDAARRLACEDGLPLIYADRWAPDFPRSPAAAPTLWYLLAAAEIEAEIAPFLWIERAVPLAPHGHGGPPGMLDRRRAPGYTSNG